MCRQTVQTLRHKQKKTIKKGRKTTDEGRRRFGAIYIKHEDLLNTSKHVEMFKVD